MLKELLEPGEGLADLFRKGRQQAERIQRLDEEVTELNQMVKVLAAAVHELANQLERDRELAAKDRVADAKGQEILRLQLENALLRFERRLPPANQLEDSPEVR